MQMHRIYSKLHQRCGASSIATSNMGQCFGRCCDSNRVHSDSTISLTSKTAQAWVEYADSGTKDNTGDKSNDAISERVTLDDYKQQTNDASTAVTIERIQSSRPHNEIDGKLEQVSRESTNQDQNDPAPFDHMSDHEKGLIPKVRSGIDVPNDFDKFIRKVIVPKFEQQRLYDRQKQFAVLLLATEEDLRDIRQMKFYPNDPPITNNCKLSMPDNEMDYRNYIVARPENDNHHAEKEIFGHLDQLWNSFIRHNHGIPPKCFILYSWNFPCTKCTQLVINSFNKPPYKSVSVIVAATAFWEKERHEVRYQNEKKMQQEQFCYGYYRNITLPEHFTNNESTCQIAMMVTPVTS